MAELVKRRTTSGSIWLASDDLQKKRPKRWI